MFRQFANPRMETVANRRGLMEFFAAWAWRLAPALGRPANLNLLRMRQTNVARTSPRNARLWRSRLQPLLQSQLSLGSIILLTQNKRPRATRRLTSSGVGFTTSLAL